MTNKTGIYDNESRENDDDRFEQPNIINWLIQGDTERGQSKICISHALHNCSIDTILRNYTLHATLIMTVQQI